MDGSNVGAVSRRVEGVGVVERMSKDKMEKFVPVGTEVR